MHIVFVVSEHTDPQVQIYPPELEWRLLLFFVQLRVQNPQKRPVSRLPVQTPRKQQVWRLQELKRREQDQKQGQEQLLL